MRLGSTDLFCPGRTRLEGANTRPVVALNSADVFSWAVVSDESDCVIEFFPTRWQAQRMLEDALRDEPDWRGILRVEEDRAQDGDGELAKPVPSPRELEARPPGWECRDP